MSKFSRPAASQSEPPAPVVRPCGYDGCSEPARVRLPAFVDGREGTGWLNVCDRHYEIEHTRRAKARVAAMGLPREFLTPTHNPAQMRARVAQIREWMTNNVDKVRAVYGEPLHTRARARLPEREPGQDDEELVA